MTIINREIIVDNFAGGGGASTGIEIAINHDPEAIRMHKANHQERKRIMYLVTKKSENNQITYFIANNLSQALKIYQREKKPLADKYGTKKGYVWDNRLLKNGEKVETVSSFRSDIATLSVSTEKKEGDLDFYLKIHELSGQSCIVIDERTAEA